MVVEVVIIWMEDLVVRVVEVYIVAMVVMVVMAVEVVEAEELTGVHVDSLDSAKKAAEYFYKKGVKKVIITLGSRGVFVSSDGNEEIIPAFKVNAVDTTGAGDAFNGGLLCALAEGKSLEEAARFANALAALSVQKLGTTPSMPTRDEIEAFLMEH